MRLGTDGRLIVAYRAAAYGAEVVGASAAVVVLDALAASCVSAMASL
jgi:hypothetical protein